MKEEAPPEYKTEKEYSLIQELEVILNVKDIPGIAIAQSTDAHNAFKAIWAKDINIRERFYAIYVNQRNQPVGWYCHSIGGINSTILDVRLIFAPVFAKGLIALATGMFIAHNHPSGNLRASSADKQITKTIKELGKLHNIGIYDHIIITKNGYTSLADDGDM